MARPHAQGATVPWGLGVCRTWAESIAGEGGPRAVPMGAIHGPRALTGCPESHVSLQTDHCALGTLSGLGSGVGFEEA